MGRENATVAELVRGATETSVNRCKCSRYESSSRNLERLLVTMSGKLDFLPMLGTSVLMLRREWVLYGGAVYWEVMWEV